MKKIFYASLIIVVGFISCNKARKNHQRILISGSEASTRVTNVADGVGIDIDSSFIDSTVVDTSTSRSISKKSTTYYFVYRGKVDAPVVDGVQTKATHIDIDGDYAFVSYNVEGETYKGAVDMVDISDIESPSVVSSMEFADADVNALAYDPDEEKLYLALASGSGLYNSPAVLEEVTISNNALTQNTRSFDLESFAGTDVEVVGDKIWVTSGDAGGVVVLNQSNLSQVSYSAYSDARAIYRKGNDVWVYKGQNGELRQYDKNSYSVDRTISTGGSAIAESKAEIFIKDGNYGLVAAGDGGVKVVNVKDDNVKNTIDNPSIDGVSDDLVVANAVTMNGNLAFIANGEAGVYVVEVKKKGSTLNPRGSMVFVEDESVNYVVSEGDVVLLARGIGGFQIFEISTDSKYASLNGLVVEDEEE